MHEQENTLVYKISSDMLKYAKKVDFGLQNVEMLDVHFDAYVKNVFHIFKGYVIGDFCYLDQLDLILIMTVEPGFGGQKFKPEQMEKIRFLRQAGFRGDIAVDGGVNMDNAPLLTQAGANLLVMGTSYFHAEDPSRVARFVEGLNR